MYIADLHIHSRFSRATSRDCGLPHLDWWSRRKGIGLVGTGDFTHPAWRAELREQLVPAGQGVISWEPIVRACKETGVKWIFAEQERWEKDAFLCMAESLDFLREMGVEP